jgi:hypothetical protein
MVQVDAMARHSTHPAFVEQGPLSSSQPICTISLAISSAGMLDARRQESRAYCQARPGAFCACQRRNHSKRNSCWPDRPCRSREQHDSDAGLSQYSSTLCSTLLPNSCRSLPMVTTRCMCQCPGHSPWQSQLGRRGRHARLHMTVPNTGNTLNGGLMCLSLRSRPERSSRSLIECWLPWGLTPAALSPHSGVRQARLAGPQWHASFTVYSIHAASDAIKVQMLC